MTRSGYSLRGHGEMIADKGRIAAHVEALKQVVRPGDVVFELGAGAGIFTVLLCELGASRVHAMEPDPVIQIARDVVASHGFSDRVTFHECFSQDVSPHERGDVVFGDMRGILPFFQQNIPSLVDARKRFLRPGGVVVPQQDLVFGALVSVPEERRRVLTPWMERPHGVDYSSVARRATNMIHRMNVSDEALLTAPQLLRTIDYRTAESADLRARVSGAVGAGMRVDGVALWFDSELADGVRMRNRPGAPPLIYGQALLPFAEPYLCASDVEFTVEVSAVVVKGDYVWTWAARVASASHDEVELGRQSTFYADVISRAVRRRRADDWRPVRGRRTEVTAAIVERIDGTHTVSDIAHWLLSEHHDLYPSIDAAIDQVLEVIELLRDA